MDSIKDQAEQSYGKRLQEARLNAGLSREGVAESLRLDYRYVVALEEEDTGALPAPTYTRGYIRAYAQLVRCNADELIAQYNVHADNDPELTDITATAVEKSGGSEPSVFWITFLVVGALIALLILWAYDSLRPMNLKAVGRPDEQAAQTQPFASPATPDETVVSAPATPDEKAVSAAGLSDSSDSTEQTVRDPVGQLQQSDVPDSMLFDAEADPGVEENPLPADSVTEIDTEVKFAPEAQTTPPENGNGVVPAAPRGSDILRLNFRGRSWVEVVDDNGFQMAYGMFENRTLNFEGQAPFRVMLGDATQVDVIINGAGVVLKPYIRWNKTANLSVGESAGSSD